MRHNDCSENSNVYIYVIYVGFKTQYKARIYLKIKFGRLTAHSNIEYGIWNMEQSTNGFFGFDCLLVGSLSLEFTQSLADHIVLAPLAVQLA